MQAKLRRSGSSGSRRFVQRRSNRHTAMSRGDERDECGCSGAQSTVHRRDAVVERKVARGSVSRRFETGFHQTIADHARYYAVPYEWSESVQLKRWGFHGGSHRYIAHTHGRVARTIGFANHLVPSWRLEFFDGHSSRKKASPAAWA